MPEAEFRPVREAVQLFTLLTQMGNQQRAADLAVAAEGRREREFRSNMESAALNRELAREKLELEKAGLALEREKLGIKKEPKPREIKELGEITRLPTVEKETIHGTEMRSLLGGLGYKFDRESLAITTEPEAKPSPAVQNLVGFYRQYQEALTRVKGEVEPAKIDKAAQDMARAFNSFSAFGAKMTKAEEKAPTGFTELFKVFSEGVKRIGAGFVSGAMTGATAAAIAGQLGPQIAVPEEVVTVPAAAGVAGVAGAAAQAPFLLSELVELYRLGRRSPER